MLVGGDWPYSALLLPHRLTPGAADGAKSRAAADLDTFGGITLSWNRKLPQIVCHPNE